MATLQDIENGLPNGFHDALIHSCTLDFVTRTASFKLDISTGDPESADVGECDRYDSATLTLEHLAFCEVQPPHPTYPFEEPIPLQVDLSEPDAGHPVIQSLPSSTFAGRFRQELELFYLCGCASRATRME